MDHGRDAGITGAVDIAGSPQFGVKVLFWNETTDISSVNNTGQGDGDLDDSLALIESGRMLLRGKVRRDLYPFPATLKNASGTLTFTYSAAAGGTAAVKMSCQVRFDKVDFKYDEKSETMWDITIGADRLGALTPTGFAGNGNQPTTTARTAGNKYLYAGREKHYDPATIGPIIDSSLQKFNLWGVAADTDAAELTAIATILAAWNTPPQTREKVYTAAVVRLSASVVQITVQWRQLNSQDAIEVPAHIQLEDPNYLGSLLASAAVFVITSGLPAIASTYLSGTPDGLKLAMRQQDQLNKFLSVDKRTYKKTDSKDDRQLPGTFTKFDLSTIPITTSGRKTLLFPTGTPPADPTPPTNSKIIGKTTLTLTAAGNPTQSEVVYEFGPANPQNRVEWGGTFKTVDPFYIAQPCAITLISSGTVPAIPAAPATGTVFVSVTQGRQLTDQPAGRFPWTFRYGPSTNADKVIDGGSFSSRSNFQPAVDVQSATGSSTSTAQVIADVLRDSFFSTPGPGAIFPYRLRVNKINPQIYRVSKTWMNPGILVLESLMSYPRDAPGRISGGNVQVWIAEKRARGNFFMYRVGRARINSPIRLFTVRRMFQQAPPIPDQAVLSNTTNNNTFLGLAAGTVYYRSAVASTNIANTGTLPFFLDYLFTNDPNGVFDFAGFQEAWYYSRANLSAGTWTNASNLTGAGIVGTIPAQADFSPFTA